jgi:hypothetical protein
LLTALEGSTFKVYKARHRAGQSPKVFGALPMEGIGREITAIARLAASATDIPFPKLDLLVSCSNSRNLGKASPAFSVASAKGMSGNNYKKLLVLI